MKSTHLVILGASAVGATLIFVLFADPWSGAASEVEPGPAGPGLSAAPDPRLEGRPPREADPTSASDTATDAPADLDTLYSEYTAGKPEAWPLLTKAPVGAKGRPDWWGSVVDGMTIFYIMPVEPFLSYLVFSDDDRPWLERVRASFDAERRRRVQGLTPGTNEFVEAIDKLSADYSALLSAVAARRAEDSPEVVRIFSDTTQLRDMEPDSPSAKWLSSMVGVVTHREMWAQRDLVKEEEASQYLCAADLIYLKDMSRVLQDIVSGMTTEQRVAPGTVARLRSEVEGLANLIASRK